MTPQIKRRTPRRAKKLRKNKPAAAVDPIKLQIERIAYHGKGIGLVDNKIVFVPDTIPGDIVLAKVERQTKNYIEATPMQILQSSSQRSVKPACSHASECGGCQWMDVPYEQQLAWKQAFVEDALQRIAKLDAKPERIIGSEQALNYRSRLRLQVKAQKTGSGFGFFRKRSHELVQVTKCPIAANPLSELIGVIQEQNDGSTEEVFAEALSDIAEISLQLAQSPTDKDQAVILLSFLPLTGQETQRHLQHRLVDRWQRRCSTTLQLITGPENEDSEIPRLFPYDHQAGLSYYTNGLQFQQVNIEANHRLRSYLQLLVKQCLPTAGRVLDLYCGSGNLSLALASMGYDVLAVEINPSAIEAAKFASISQGLNEQTHFVCGDAKTVGSMPEITAERPDLLICDPPRRGLGEEIQDILDWRPKFIIYVSCNPITMARDLNTFKKQGYTCKSVQPFDFFPHSYHVESVSLLML